MGNHNPGDKPMKVDDVDPDLVSYYEPGGQYWSDAPDGAHPSPLAHPPRQPPD